MYGDIVEMLENYEVRIYIHDDMWITVNISLIYYLFILFILYFLFDLFDLFDCMIYSLVHVYNFFALTPMTRDCSHVWTSRPCWSNLLLTR